MIRPLMTLASLVCFLTVVFAQEQTLSDGLYAKIDTSKGLITIKLEYQKVPLTVMNFVGLAEGILKNNHKKPGVPYYDGLIFHRVISNFMIQGGCPLGKGYGTPGYKFRDEFDPSLKHVGPGILSMANSGKNTNGSQFFITHSSQPHLDNRHSVFGKVIKGLEVVNQIAKGDSIKTIRIVRVGTEANAFQVSQQAFDKLNLLGSASGKPVSLYEKAKARWPEVQKTNSGLLYVIEKSAAPNAKKANANSTVTVHYTGTLFQGKVFDSSVVRGEPITFPLGQNKVIRGWEIGLAAMAKGEKRKLIIPPELGYGKSGREPIIPGNAVLVFDVELVDVK